MKKAALVIISLMLLVGTGLAQKGVGSGNFNQTVDLAATPQGADSGFEGQALIAQRNGVQYFGVRCFAKADDGTIYQVRVTTSEGTFKVGAITIFQGAGQLLLQSSKDSLSAVFPVTDIQAVSVYELGAMLAEASF